MNKQKEKSRRREALGLICELPYRFDQLVNKVLHIPTSERKTTLQLLSEDGEQVRNLLDSYGIGLPFIHILQCLKEGRIFLLNPHPTLPDTQEALLQQLDLCLPEIEKALSPLGTADASLEMLRQLISVYYEMRAI